MAKFFACPCSLFILTYYRIFAPEATATCHSHKATTDEAKRPYKYPQGSRLILYAKSEQGVRRKESSITTFSACSWYRQEDLLTIALVFFRYLMSCLFALVSFFVINLDSEVKSSGVNYKNSCNGWMRQYDPLCP